MDRARRDRRGTWAGRFLRAILVFLAGALLGANVLYYLMRTGHVPAPVDADAGVAAPRVAPPAPPAVSPAAPSSIRPAPAPRPSSVPTPAPAPGSTLVIPVAGITAAQLLDTYTQSRGSGRLHDAIDIMAPAGTPVLAAVDGRIVKLFDSAAGGITLYQFDPAEQFVYYYAHLQGYAPGMAEGRVLRRGEVLGYVGSTGNANPEGPHLHFAIARLDADKRWHGGTPVNPYPLLAGRAAVAAPAASAPPAR